MSRLFLLLSLGGFLLLATSCKKDSTDPDIEITDPNNGSSGNSNGSLNELDVPDGFQFGVATNANFNISFTDEELNEVDSVLYTIMGVNHNEETEILLQGHTGGKSIATFVLPIPYHFKSVIIKTDHKNDTKYFEYLVTENIDASLTINGFANNGADPRSNNCYPTINNVFTPDDTGFSITTDQTMTTIEVTYTDGSTETITVNATSFIK